MAKQEAYISFRGEYLGDVAFAPASFPQEIFKEIDTPQFKKLSSFEKHERVNQTLFDAIQNEEKEPFLLPQVVNYITHVRNVLPTYHLTSFEFWLNQYAEAPVGVKFEVRGKIVGKGIPRSEYQNFFPIQKGSYFFGSHYSCAHFSPDLDTTTASFACFLSAFGARVGEGRHHWALPGGPPKESMEIELCFKKALGGEVFSVLSAPSTKLVITALDLISQHNIVQKKGGVLTHDLDPGKRRHAIILVDEAGGYLADWRAADVDAVRSIIIRFKALLAEYQNTFTTDMITLFSQRKLDLAEWKKFLEKKFTFRFCDTVVAQELDQRQKRHLDEFMSQVVGLSKGLEATMKDFFHSAKEFGFVKLQKHLEGVTFDDLGEERHRIFSTLKEIVSLEKQAFQQFFSHIDSLGVAVAVKQKVLGRGPTTLSHLAEYEEILQSMKGYDHLTVNYEENGTHYPLGVIYAEDIQRKMIATSSWNDFSNPSETDAREGVEVISFIDHHKSDVTTVRPSFGLVRADAQSSNSIMARISFEINDRYSTGGMTLVEIESEIKKAKNDRILQRLLQKRQAAKTKGKNYISPDREFLEYLQYLFAILDDTDLLTKVTEYDVDGMASLLNRLKSLMLRKEVEIVNFDDLSRSDLDFAKLAAKKLLHTPDLYSLYGVVYKAKEEAIDTVVRETGAGKETHFFQDTKVLGPNSYASVGQFKHFAKNEPMVRKYKKELRKAWVEQCKERDGVLLHIFMLSTIASSEELFSETAHSAKYADEVWFWVPEDKRAYHYLENFLREFQKGRSVIGAEFCGHAAGYEKVFQEAFHKKLETQRVSGEPAMAVLKVAVGSIKSRKTDIAVYL